MLTSAGFRVVGIELGLPMSAGDDVHWTPRVEKALLPAQRLRSLPLLGAVL